MDKINRPQGFSLVELLVVITIVVFLSAVGLVSFQNIQTNAKDAKRRADIDAISKAYEVKYDPSLNGGQGGYRRLEDTDFAGNKIPTPPDGTSYNFVSGPNSSSSLTGTDQSYRVCALLGSGSGSCANPSPSCYCKSSSQQAAETRVIVAASCADGTNDQIYGAAVPNMVGCNGAAVFAGAGALCGAGSHLCTIDEYLTLKDTRESSQDRWTATAGTFGGDCGGGHLFYTRGGDHRIFVSDITNFSRMDNCSTTKEAKFGAGSVTIGKGAMCCSDY